MSDSNKPFQAIAHACRRIAKIDKKPLDTGLFHFISLHATTPDGAAQVDTGVYMDLALGR
jgi:hypothetical protein